MSLTSLLGSPLRSVTELTRLSNVAGVETDLYGNATVEVKCSPLVLRLLAASQASAPGQITEPVTVPVGFGAYGLATLPQGLDMTIALTLLRLLRNALEGRVDAMSSLGEATEFTVIPSALSLPIYPFLVDVTNSCTNSVLFI